MIAIKGHRHGLLIVFNGASETPWLSHLRELEAKLDAYPHFFRGSSVAFDVKDATLNAEDLRHAIDMLRTREVKLWAVLSHNAETCAHVRSLGLADRLPAISTAQSTPEQPVPAHDARKHSELSSGEIGESLFVRQRIRSGQVLRHPGHIIVMGDVNPGAQLIAGGDIIVWGRLNGAVHAGALGDSQAVVCALEMLPTCVRIAEAVYIPRALDRRQRRKRAAEMALLKEQEIIIMSWDVFTHKTRLEGRTL
jgi:septum site-determining protein MinC